MSNGLPIQVVSLKHRFDGSIPYLDTSHEGTRLSAVLPLALDSGWAALGGALIGSVAGGVVTAILASLNRRKLAKSGARLVAMEIEIADNVVADFEHVGRVRDEQRFGMKAWPDYQEVLASYLGDAEMEAVGRAVTDTAFLRDQFPETKLLAESQTVWIAKMRKELRLGYNALSRLAGHRKLSQSEWHNRFTPRNEPDTPD